MCKCQVQDIKTLIFTSEMYRLCFQNSMLAKKSDNDCLKSANAELKGLFNVQGVIRTKC